MIKLVPSWARDYQEYWNSIRNRNIWFIHIRYVAVLMLATIFLMASYIFDLKFSSIQIFVLAGINITILVYNVIFHKLRTYLTCTPGKFNPLHFSLLQIILDLLILMLLVYYTGSIESPIYMLFIFHMIIGSLILPGRVILAIAVIVTCTFSSIVLLEYYSLIPHHHLFGLYNVELKENSNFIISSIGIFNFIMFTAVLITSRIAKRLYQREKELLETLKKLDEAEKAKQKYTMAVVHEIKSPIVAAQSIIEIVKNGYVGEINEKIESKLVRTISRTNEALQLINNILKISKLKLLGEVAFEKVDFKKLLDKVIDKKIDAIDKKKIAFTFSDLRNENELIDGDTVLFELVISNVLGNSVKYTNDNGKILFSVNDKDKFIQLTISDTGIGIPEDEIKMIFQQFYRATNLPNKYAEGSGFGLTFVKEIIEGFDGEIEVRSPSEIGTNEKPGTTVIIQLPKIHE